MSFLPGWFPAGAAVGLTSLSVLGSNTSEGLGTVAVPTGTRNGDLLVLWDLALNTSGVPTGTLSSGFTQIANLNNGNNLRTMLSMKIADGTEINLTGMNGNAGNAKMVYAFRGNELIKTATVAGVNQEMTSANPTAQNVSASGQKTPLVIIGAYRSSAAVNPRTFSPAKDGEILVAAGLAYLAYKVYNAAPADTSIDMDDEGNDNALASCYIACS